MIRLATPADAPAVRRLQQLLDDPAPALLSTALDANAPTAIGQVMLAETDRIVGYALTVPGPQEHAPSSVYLAELAVTPDARREDHATALVDDVAARYAEHDRLEVVVAADDPDARQFYQAVGFNEQERLPDRFDGRDGWLLFRRLP